MKKFISILMAVAMSLMVTTIALAEEAPVIKIEPYAIPESEIEDYGVIENYDAYLLNVYVSGVDANRTNANTVSGRVMASFELTFTAENSDIIDWENSYMWESDAGAELVKGTGAFQISSGEPTRNASFPAKNSTIAADEENLFASALIYIPTGESLEFEVKDLSLVFSTYASGSIADSSLTKIYDIRSSENPISCATRELTLGTPAGGDDDDDDDTTEKVVQAETQWKNNMTGILFTANDGTLNGKYAVEITGIESEGTTVKAGLKVTGIPSDKTVTIAAENYYGTTFGVIK